MAGDPDCHRPHSLEKGHLRCFPATNRRKKIDVLEVARIVVESDIANAAVGNCAHDGAAKMKDVLRVLNAHHPYSDGATPNAVCADPC